MKKINADAVILDVDGTIWDSTPVVAKAWTSALNELDEYKDRVLTADELKTMFGKTMDQIEQILMPDVEEEKRHRVCVHCFELEDRVLAECDDDLTYPGVVEVIEEVGKSLPVCIVSNAQKGYIELVIEKTGLSCVKDHLCFGDTLLDKDENIRMVCERNGYKNAVYVGDTAGDLALSRKAGVGFIWASYGFGEIDREEADAVIDNPQQLKEVLGL